jgi:hypothetical protein
MGRNAKQNADSRRACEKKTRVSSASEPAAELADGGGIGAVLTGLIARKNKRDSKGRFGPSNAAHLGGLEYSAQLRAALEPLKRDMVQRVRVQLAADTDDAPETLLGVIDAYAEARLLRSSAFVRLSQLGGFVTAKGNARALLSTWGAAFDREMRAAERLGLVRRARRTQTPIEWLRSLDDNEQHKEEDDDEQAPDAEQQPGSPITEQTTETDQTADTDRRG